jgi:hypothetical protein
VCLSVPTKAFIVDRKSVKVQFSGMDVRGIMVRFPTGRRGFSLSQNVETAAGIHPLGTWTFPQFEVKRPEREAARLSLYSVELMVVKVVKQHNCYVRIGVIFC